MYVIFPLTTMITSSLLGGWSPNSDWAPLYLCADRHFQPPASQNYRSIRKQKSVYIPWSLAWNSNLNILITNFKSNSSELCKSYICLFLTVRFEKLFPRKSPFYHQLFVSLFSIIFVKHKHIEVILMMILLYLKITIWVWMDFED